MCVGKEQVSVLGKERITRLQPCNSRCSSRGLASRQDATGLWAAQCASKWAGLLPSLGHAGRLVDIWSSG